MVTTNKFPNLEDFERGILRNIAKQYPEYIPFFKAHNVYTETSVECFPQVWASTAGGFEEPGMLAGCAMTTEITTVMKISFYFEDKEDAFYGVAFGQKSAYLVHNPTQEFLTDLANHKLKSVYEGKKAY